MKKLLLLLCLFASSCSGTFAQTTPINNLVLKTAGSAQTGVMFANGTSAANATNTPIINGVTTISGGTSNYTDYILLLSGWPGSGGTSTKDAGISLQPYYAGAANSGSGFIDFWQSNQSSGTQKGRIGRNPPDVGAALFVGTGGDVPNATQLGSRDNTALEIFTNDNARIFVTGSGNVGVGAFTNSSQPTSLFHVLGNETVTGTTTVATVNASTALSSNGTINIGTGTATSTWQASGGNTFFDTASVGGGTLNIRSLAGDVVIKAANILSATFSGGNTTLSGNLSVTGYVAITSGTNKSAGTVTLVAGTATITSTAITANSVIVFSEKTSGGTPGLYQPLAAVSAGSATVTSAVTDTSTYNWVELKVN